MKGNHRTLFGQSLLSEATSGDLVVEAYPGSTLTDNAVSIGYFDYLNKQNSPPPMQKPYLRGSSASIGSCNCEILPR